MNLVAGVVNESTSAGASLQLEYNGYSINQHFVLEANEDGTYNLRPIMSGLLVSAGEEGAVTQEKANSVFAQKWVIAPTLDGHFTLATVDGVLLGANGVAAGQTLLASAAAKGAIWNLISVPLLPTGFYNIKLVGDSGIVLDVSENSVRPHANVGGWEDNGTNAQKFLISNIEGDVYQIFGAWSALALDVTDEVAAAGANIQQFNKNDSPAQKWIITWENGGFIFKSALGEFALSLVEKDGVYNAELSDYDKNNDNQRFLISQAKLTKASISDLVAVLDEYCYGNGLKAFKSMNELSSATTAKLWSAIQAFYNIGCSVGFTMLDLNTGIGLTYNSERVFDSACSIKGPYSIALAQYSPESLWKYENEFYWALHVSDNPTYQKYFFNSGTWPLNNYAAQVHLEHFSWNSWVAHYTAEDLCRLWVASQEYLLSDTKEAAWLRNVLYQNGANMTRIACAEYEVWPVFAKSGWTNYTRTEGSLVMADSPYVCGIMSTTNKEHSYLLVNLADAIYLAHQELVYGV